jgi:hypothetical protein
MPIFTKTTVPSLIYNQKVLTGTIGSDIGINALVATDNANFAALESLLDRNAIGLSDDNIKFAGITNASTNLISDYQVGLLTPSLNKPNSDGVTIYLLNGTFQCTRNFQKVNFHFGGSYEPYVAISSEDLIFDFGIQIATNSAFTGATTTIATNHGMAMSLDPAFAFNRRPLYSFGQKTDTTATTYYYRMYASMGGGATGFVNIFNPKILITMN